MLLKAKGSFGLGFAVTRPDRESNNFQRHLERKWESKSKRWTDWNSAENNNVAVWLRKLAELEIVPI